MDWIALFFGVCFTLLGLVLCVSAALIDYSGNIVLAQPFLVVASIPVWAWTFVMYVWAFKPEKMKQALFKLERKEKRRK